jgi:hypothetical protein
VMVPLPLDVSTREALARAIHEAYVARVVGSSESNTNCSELVPYEDLPSEMRESKRRQADDLETKVEMIGATIVPWNIAPVLFEFTSAELECLSRHEHARWMREKLQAGWQFGPKNDPVAHTHRCLVPYDELTEEEREKDRHAVERIPRLLRTIGFGIIRRGSR